MSLLPLRNAEGVEFSLGLYYILSTISMLGIDLSTFPWLPGWSFIMRSPLAWSWDMGSGREWPPTVALKFVLKVVFLGLFLCHLKGLTWKRKKGKYIPLHLLHCALSTSETLNLLVSRDCPKLCVWWMLAGEGTCLLKGHTWPFVKRARSCLEALSECSVSNMLWFSCSERLVLASFGVLVSLLNSPLHRCSRHLGSRCYH